MPAGAAVAAELRWPPRAPRDFMGWLLAAACLLAVPVLAVGSYVLVRALLVVGYIFGLVPAWMISWWPSWC